MSQLPACDCKSLGQAATASAPSTSLPAFCPPTLMACVSYLHSQYPAHQISCFSPIFIANLCTLCQSGPESLPPAHAFQLRWSGSRGLLQPLLKRYQARGCPVSVFGLPAVQAVIQFKWTTWAHRFLVRLLHTLTSTWTSIVLADSAFL